MNNITVKQLIDLNNKFYQQIAGSFSQTRSYSWAGWEDIAAIFKEEQFMPATVLDLGCGNGRFADFALKHWEIKNYLGIDASKDLLKFALEQHRGLEQISFREQDFFASPKLDDNIEGLFDLVVIMGVMHHIPGEELRRQILTAAAKKISPNGYLVVSFWDFLSEQKLSKKVVPWSEAGFKATDVDEHDYLLDWKRDDLAYRYCHYYMPDEINELVTAAGLLPVKQFLADGPGGRANRYLLCKRTAQ